MPQGDSSLLLHFDQDKVLNDWLSSYYSPFAGGAAHFLDLTTLLVVMVKKMAALTPAFGDSAFLQSQPFHRIQQDFGGEQESYAQPSQN